MVIFLKERYWSMNKDYETKVSRFISLVLRHKPEVINIELDANGWANVNELLSGMSEKGYTITPDDLNFIVSNDNKGRYRFSDDHTKIRANQGHSIQVDVALQELKPPHYLYHGTGEKSIDAIKKYGLRAMSRLYVHLSCDYETAISVGKRHGKPIVLKIASEKMYNDGFKFYLSENNVWLAAEVPNNYIIIESKTPQQS